MDDNGEKPTPPRRSFLKSLATATGLILSSGGTNILRARHDDQIAHAPSLRTDTYPESWYVNKPTLGELKSTIREEQPRPEIVRSKTSSPEAVKEKTPTEQELLNSLFNKSYTNKERREILDEVRTEQRRITLNPEIFEATLEKLYHHAMPLIEVAMKRFEDIKGYQLNPNIKYLFLGLIFAENSQMSKEVSSGGAIGLSQLTEIAVKDAEIFLKITHGKYDFRNSDLDNIFLGFSYLMLLDQRFKDLPVAIWGYHFGSGNITYARYKMKEILKRSSEPNLAEMLYSDHTPLLKRVISQYPLAQDALKDNTYVYPSRVVAAALEFRKFIEKKNRN